MIRKNDEFVLEITQPNGTLLCQVVIHMNDDAKRKWHGDDVSYSTV